MQCPRGLTDVGGRIGMPRQAAQRNFGQLSVDWIPAT